MKKYLLLALASLLSPLVAGAITPKPGHYSGTAVDIHHVVHRTISFDLVALPHHYVIRHVHMPPNIFNNHGFAHDSMEITGHRMDIDFRDVVNIQFKGHAKWEADNKVAGDFRERSSVQLGEGHNTYYTWHAHWKHE